MEFLCKSNAKKLASFAETPPKIMGAAHKNGKKATVNDSSSLKVVCRQVLNIVMVFIHMAFLVNKSRFLVNKKD